VGQSVDTDSMTNDRLLLLWIMMHHVQLTTHIPHNNRLVSSNTCDYLNITERSKSARYFNNVLVSLTHLTFLYKILNEHVAVPMNQLDLVLCDRPVRGSTTKQRLKIPRCASTQFQKSFAARTITE